MKRLYIAAVIIELFGICLTSFGLAYETIMKADVGFVIITSGSLLIATGGLLFSKVAPWLRELQKIEKKRRRRRHQ